MEDIRKRIVDLEAHQISSVVGFENFQKQLLDEVSIIRKSVASCLDKIAGE